MADSCSLRVAALSWGVLLSLALTTPAWGKGADLAILNARLIDGTGAPAREDVTIVVRAGRIETIGTEPPPVGVSIIDASSATVLPGLIDAHVHLAAAPGSAFRHDTLETVQELNHLHLRAYLANGVTTIFDPQAPVAIAKEAQRWLAAGNPGPRYLTTGPMLSVPGGYGVASSFGLSVPGGPLAEAALVVRTPADVEAALDVIRSIGGIGVKLSVEYGFNPFGSMPTYPPEVRDAIARGAAARGLPVYVHAMSEREDQAALDLGAHAIMHAPRGGHWTGHFFGSRDLSDGFVARMVKSRAYQVTTFSVIDTWPNGYDTHRLDDPLVRLTVPPVELATARDPEAARFFAVSMLGAAVPWTFEFMRPWMARHVWSPENLHEGLRYSQRNVLKLYRAGVPVVAATDAPSFWPLAIYHFHGPQTAREIELLGEAGLSPIEALAAATRVPAEMLGIDREVGTVEVGKRGDLLIVAGDPLADLRALRNVRWTVKDGVAHTPEQWMQPATSR